MKTLAGGTLWKTLPRWAASETSVDARQELGDLGEEREDLDEELDDALLDLTEPARGASAGRSDEDTQFVHDSPWASALLSET